jgi:hypothetical protein
MATKVHVILSGIVSLIPGAGSPPAQWTIRLHDARTHPHHPHFPSLVAEKDFATTATPYDRNKAYAGGELYGWWMENGPITIKSTIVSGVISVPSPLPYVLSMQDGCSGVASCPIAKAYDGVYLNVANGSIQATELEGGMWQWDPSAKPAAWIAEEVCWEFEIKESELSLSVAHSSGTLDLRLSPPSVGVPGQGGDIELRLQNSLKLDIFPIYGPGKPTTDPHASLYFSESSAAPGSIPDLRQYKPSGSVPKLPNHYHRLTDTTIGTRIAAHAAAPRESRAAAEKMVEMILAKGKPTLRVNCPPAQWAG